MKNRTALAHEVAGTLASAYRLEAAGVERVAAGAETTNFRITDQEGRRWFAKVYLHNALPGRERRAVELAEFARTDRVPVPAVRRTVQGNLVEHGDRLAMSLWEYVGGAETAEGGLTGARWPAVGAVLGRLHRRLAEHPAARPRLSPGRSVCDLPRARTRFDRLIHDLAQRPDPGPFARWALEAARERRALLDQLPALLDRLPPLTEQIVHGDLAAPNLMLRGNDVAALVDFQPPRPRFTAWEIARIALDPRTVTRGNEWLDQLPALLAAYRNAHPATRAEDLLSTVTTGCAYTLASPYPLTLVPEDTAELDHTLQTYARTRHETGLTLLHQLDEAEEAVREDLR